MKFNRMSFAPTFKTSLFSLIFGFLALIPLSAKVYVFDLGEELEALVQQGADCLDQQKTGCEDHFQEALSLAKSMDQDSLLAMTYFEICTAIEYYGKEEDRIRYAREGIMLDGEKHPTVTNRLHREIAVCHRRMGEMDSIIPAYDIAMKWAKYSKDNSNIAATYIQLAGAYNRLGKVDKSIEVLLEGKPYAEASGDPHRVHGLEFVLAGAYLANDDLEKAFEKFDNAAKGFLEIEDSAMYVRAITNQAIAGVPIKKLDEALKNLPIAIAYLEKTDPNAIVYPTVHYGEALMETGQYEEALAILTDNLENAKRANNTYITLLTQKHLSKCYLKMGKAQLALPFAESAYRAEKEKGYSNGYASAMEQYAVSLKANGRYAQAANIYEELQEVKDTLWTQAKVEEIAGLQEFYEAEKRESEIKLLKEEVKVERLQTLLALAGLGALAIILGLVYWQFQERAKRARLEQEKLSEELAFKQRELTTHALHIAKKNEFLIDIKDRIKASQQTESPKNLQGIVNTINMDLVEESNWDQFIIHFEQVHSDFYKNLQQNYPDLTVNELRLLALMKMKLSSKEIASMLNITQDSVKKARYRLRKKLKLSGENSLESLLVQL